MDRDGTQKREIDHLLYFGEGQHRAVAEICRWTASNFTGMTPTLQYGSLTEDWIKNCLKKNNINESDEWHEQLNHKSFKLDVVDDLRETDVKNEEGSTLNKSYTVKIRYIKRDNIDVKILLAGLKSLSEGARREKTHCSSMGLLDSLSHIQIKAFNGRIFNPTATDYNPDFNRCIDSDVANTVNVANRGKVDWKKVPVTKLEVYTPRKRVKNSVRENPEEYTEYNDTVKRKGMEEYMLNPTEDNFRTAVFHFTTFPVEESPDGLCRENIYKHTFDSRHVGEGDISEEGMMQPPFQHNFNSLCVDPGKETKGKQLTSTFEVNNAVMYPLVMGKCIGTFENGIMSKLTSHYKEVMKYMIKYHGTLNTITSLDYNDAAEYIYGMDGVNHILNETNAYLGGSMFIVMSLQAILCFDKDLNRAILTFSQMKLNQTVTDKKLLTCFGE